MDDPYRGTGRTTGLIFQAIGNAILARGPEVEVVDHYPHTRCSAEKIGKQIQTIVKAAGLLMDVRLDETRVFVRSRMKFVTK